MFRKIDVEFESVLNSVVFTFFATPSTVSHGPKQFSSSNLALLKYKNYPFKLILWSITSQPGIFILKSPSTLLIDRIPLRSASVVKRKV
jgi:hypothetical protein